MTPIPSISISAGRGFAPACTGSIHGLMVVLDVDKVLDLSQFGVAA